LTAEDSPGTDNVYVRDRQSAATILVSRPIVNYDAGTGYSDLQHLSEDGAWVVFESYGTDLSDAGQSLPVQGGPPPPDPQIYAFDVASGVNKLASLALNGGFAQGVSSFPTTSADGGRVFFLSTAPDLTVNEGDGGSYIFLRDDFAKTTVVLSALEVEYPQGLPMATSRDGTTLAFLTANALDPVRDANGAVDVYTYALGASTANLTSRGLNGFAAGATPTGGAVGLGLTDDGTAAVFASGANNIVANDTNNVSDIFVAATGCP
jgi:hypothetical protein